MFAEVFWCLLLCCTNQKHIMPRPLQTFYNNIIYHWRKHCTHTGHTHLNVLALLSRVGGKSNPAYLLLLFWDDIHSHQNIKGIIHTTSDVLLINGLRVKVTTFKYYAHLMYRLRVSLPFELNLVPSFHILLIPSLAHQQPIIPITRTKIMIMYCKHQTITLYGYWGIVQEDTRVCGGQRFWKSMINSCCQWHVILRWDELKLQTRGLLHGRSINYWRQ